VLTSKSPAREDRGADAAPVTSPGDTTSVRPATIGTRPRAIYPYSVIRGGAYSSAELDAALRADPTAAAHYAGFDRTRTRVTRAPASTAVYVSYRQGNRIYWTRRKVRLAANEALLTDGVHTARARCGNRISLTPPEPAQAREPDIDLDLPEAANAPPDVFSLPRVVDEIFPPLLGSWLPPGGSVGPVPEGMGTLGFMALPMSRGESAPPGFRLPLLPEVTIPPPMPNVWPIDFTTTAVPPSGPGFGWIPPIPFPGGWVPGNTIAPPPEGTPSAPPLGWVPPPFPGIAPNPIPGITPLPGITPIPGTPDIPPPPTIPGPEFPSPPDAPPWQPVPPPDSPPSPSVETPEPATTALLLCAAAILAGRQLFSRFPR
jgi:hypothetical protein